MATIAIDPTDRPTISPAEPRKVHGGRKTFLVAGGVALGLAGIGGAGAAIVSSLTLPTSLSGLAFLPKPEAPRRSEIRIGRLPDMPEIRDGVPAVVGTRPVRMVETQAPASPAAAPAPTGPKPVAAAVMPAATLPTAPLPTTFTHASPPQLMGPSAPAFVPAKVETAPATSAGPTRAGAVAALGPAASEPKPTPAQASELTKAEPAATSEPASTASVPALVPLPPPAPVRAASRAPEPAPRPAAQIASRRAAPAPAPNAPPATPAENAVPGPPAEERVEILGVKLPNGSDLKNAVSSIGEALNLPKAF